MWASLAAALCAVFCRNMGLDMVLTFDPEHGGPGTNKKRWVHSPRHVCDHSSPPDLEHQTYHA